MNSLQYNMVAHGTGSVDDDVDNGQITKWVSKTLHIHRVYRFF